MLALDQNPLVAKIAPACGHAEAVATAFPCATDAGLEILRAGGNAIDAAVAAAWALCACEPSAWGIGGQKVLLVYRAHGAAPGIDGESSPPRAAPPETHRARGAQR